MKKERSSAARQLEEPTPPGNKLPGRQRRIPRHCHNERPLPETGWIALTAGRAGAARPRLMEAHSAPALG